MQLDFDEAYEGLRDVCLRLLGCEKATLFLLDERNKELRWLSPTTCLLAVIAQH